MPRNTISRICMKWAIHSKDKKNPVVIDICKRHNSVLLSDLAQYMEERIYRNPMWKSLYGRTYMKGVYK